MANNFSMNYGITVNQNGIITATLSTPLALPSGWITITEAQYPSAQVQGATWDASTSTVNPPATNYNLNQVQQSQIALVYQQLQAALVSPYAFTTSGGVSSSFPMDAVSQGNYSNAYTMYVLGGETLPSGFFFYDVNQNAVPFAVADIKALYLGAASREQGYYAAFEKAKTDILAATTVSAVQAISLSSP